MTAAPARHADTGVAFTGFSSAEFARRRHAFEQVLDHSGLAHGVLYGANRSGSAVPWLTGWPVTREAHVLVTPGEPDVLLVSFFNHVPEAARRAPAADVRFATDDPIANVLEILKGRGATRAPIGFVGPLPYDQHAALSEGRRLVDLRAEHTRLRMTKSEEEVAALRYAAALTDSSVRSMLDAGLQGRTEHQLAAVVESSYVSRGGMHHIHYFGVTPMSDPRRCVPAQWPTDRRIERGDLLSFEISVAAAPDYSAQLLRTVAVGASPSREVEKLHEVAERAFEAVEALLRPGVHVRELVGASGVIEDAGFTTVDDLVHGFGGGYLPPVLGTRSRRIRPTPDIELEAGMTVVVQPNVCRPDHLLGVQTGELMLVSPEGPQRLHTAARGLWQAR